MNMKRITAALLALVMLLALCACGGENGEGTSGKAPEGYQVKVVDALGNPYTEGVIVRFMQGGTQVAMQVVNAEGIAIKELEDGEYTVELQHTDADAEYHYDTAGKTLSPNRKTMEVVMNQAVSGTMDGLFAYSLLTDGNKEHTAGYVKTGCTYVDLVSGERNYFLFAPQESGTYVISAVGEVQVGYYGGPSFVQQVSAMDVVDNTVTLSISDGNIAEGGGSVYVLGLDAAEDVTSGVLCIQRTGAAQRTLEDEPWLVYTAMVAPTEYTLTLEDGQQLKKVDIKGATEDYKLVKNDADGYYHLGTADGPVMLVQLCAGQAGNPSYICFEDMVGDGTPDKGVTALRKYFFDENGDFIKKEDYTQCMISYNVCADKTYGVYPLTDELIYMIQQGGDQLGWYDKDGPGYLFLDEGGNHVMGINAEISWMFACCYVA